MSDVALYDRPVGSQQVSLGRHFSERERSDRRTMSLLRLPFSCRTFTTLPYDLLLNIISSLRPEDVLNLMRTCKSLQEYTRSHIVWRNLALDLLDECKPLPVDGFRRLWELPTPDLIKVVLRGVRRRDSWVARCPALIPSYTVINAPPAEDIAWLSPITSKYTLCCTKTGKVSCWNVQRSACVAEWAAGEEWEMWKCRVEFDERIVYFAMARKLVTESQTECQLMSLQFPSEDDADVVPPSFSTLTKFNFPGQVSSVYLLDPSRRLLSAYIWMENTHTLGLYVLLDWDVPLYCFVDTGIEFKENPMREWSCIGYDPAYIVIHAEEVTHVYQYFYPIAVLRDYATHEPPSRPSRFLPPAKQVTLPFLHNHPLFESYTMFNSHFVRQWWPTLLSPSIRRCSCTIMLCAIRDPDTQMHLVTIAQHYFTIPLRQQQLRRWYVQQPFEIVCFMHSPDHIVPLIAVDFGHAVWLEYTNSSTESKLLRFVTFPSVDIDRGSEGFQQLSNGGVHTLDTPAGVDLDKVCHMGIDQAEGTVILGLSDGTVFILRYE